MACRDHPDGSCVEQAVAELKRAFAGAVLVDENNEPLSSEQEDAA